MTDTKIKPYSRREFLQLSWTLGAGLAVPPVLYGCGGGGDGSSLAPLPEETFVQPEALASLNGRLDVTYTGAVVSGPRAFEEALIAGTPQVHAGDAFG